MESELWPRQSGARPLSVSGAIRNARMTAQNAQPLRSIGQRLESWKRPQPGTIDYLAPWLDRAGAMIFDGIPLRDHPLDSPGPRAGEKEKLALLLVACDVDRQVRRIVTLSERHDQPTPDFEAQLLSGETVRIELTSFRDDVATPYVGNLEKTFDMVRQTLEGDLTIEKANEGRYFVFGFPGEAPRAADAKKAAMEIVQLVKNAGMLSDKRIVNEIGLRSMLEPTDCPLLTEIGAWWCVSAVSQPDFRVQYTVAADVVDYNRILAAVPTVLANKSHKIAGYSDGGLYPVWLAVFMADGISYSPLSALQELRHCVPDPTEYPFERILIGLSTAGILLERDISKRSYYNSLSEYHGAVQLAAPQQPPH